MNNAPSAVVRAITSEKETLIKGLRTLADSIERGELHAESGVCVLRSRADETITLTHVGTPMSTSVVMGLLAFAQCSEFHASEGE